MELIRYDAMCTAIAECERVDEVKDIRDKAVAIEAYAKQAMNTEAERQACNIRLRAERKVGHMLKETERGAGSKGQLNGRDASGKANMNRPENEPSEYQQAKDSAGISDTQAKRWQNLAGVSEKEFEEALADPDTKPSTSGLIKKANGSTSKMDPKVLWLWGRIRDFEREGIGEHRLSYLISEMTATQQADLKRIVPTLVSFFATLQENLS